MEVRRSSRISKKETLSGALNKKTETVITLDDFPSPPPVRSRRSSKAATATTPKKRKVVATATDEDSSQESLTPEDNITNDHLPPIFASNGNQTNKNKNKETPNRSKRSSSSTQVASSTSNFNLVSSEGIKEALSSLHGASAKANFNKILSLVGGEPEVITVLINDSRFSDYDLDTAKRLSYLALTSSSSSSFELLLQSFLTTTQRIDSKHDEDAIGLIKTMMVSRARHCGNDGLLEELLSLYCTKTSRHVQQLRKPASHLLQSFLDVVFHFVGTPSSSSSSSSLLINTLKEVLSSNNFTKDSLFISSVVERTLSPKWFPYYPPSSSSSQDMRTLLNWIWLARWSKKNLGSLYLDRYTIVNKLVPGITPTIGSVLQKALKSSSSSTIGSLEDLVSTLLIVDDETFDGLTRAIGLLKKRKRAERHEDGGEVQGEGEGEGGAGLFFVDTRRNQTTDEQRKKPAVTGHQDDETSLEQELGELIGSLKRAEQEEDEDEDE